MNVLAITYLNRLSDLLFILARHANRENGDVLWVPGGERGAAAARTRDAEPAAPTAKAATPAARPRATTATR